MQKSDLKNAVKKHWEEETCGIRYGESADRAKWIEEIEEMRYKLEPHILKFANFESGRGKKVLEIGVGAGSDFANWIRAGAIATGVDLTQAAIDLALERMRISNRQNQSCKLLTADAENLPFDSGEFDIVYSWGVLHHTPDTVSAFEEAFRVLKPGGVLKAMIYHHPSWTGFLLWIKTCLLKGRPFKSFKRAVFENLESPGTKTFTLREARSMLKKIGFENIHLTTKLCAGDLLEIKPSKKYQSAVYKIIWKLYPRRLVKLMGDRFGLNLLIIATKPLSNSQFFHNKFKEIS